MHEAKYWDDIGATWSPAGPHALWRAHSDAVNTALLSRWLPGTRVPRALKTDLFDEIAGEGLLELVTAHAAEVVGCDIASDVAHRARDRYPALRAVPADVRHLPFAAGAFDVVVSLSTLDHFASLGELEVALREVARVTRPGGQLFLTLDNPGNPAVALRNALPFQLLRRGGLVPYYVGATCGHARLRSILESAGFQVQEMGAVLHCPRVLAVAIGRLLERWAPTRVRGSYLRLLARYERLAAWRTRFRTGHFIAVRAVRAPAAAPAGHLAGGDGRAAQPA